MWHTQKAELARLNTDTLMNKQSVLVQGDIQNIRKLLSEGSSTVSKTQPEHIYMNCVDMHGWS